MNSIFTLPDFLCSWNVHSVQFDTHFMDTMNEKPENGKSASWAYSYTWLIIQRRLLHEDENTAPPMSGGAVKIIVIGPLGLRGLQSGECVDLVGEIEVGEGFVK